MASRDIIVKKSDQAGGTPSAIEPDMKLAVIGRSLGSSVEGTANFNHASGAGGGSDDLSNITSPSHELGEYVNSIESVLDSDSEEYRAGINFKIKETSSDEEVNKDLIRDSDGNRLTIEELTLDWTITPALEGPYLNKTVSYTAVSGAGAVDPSKVVWYAMTVLDKNGRESTIGALCQVAIQDPDDVDLTEVKVLLTYSKPKYVSGYRLYRTEISYYETNGLVTPSRTDLKLLATITDVNQTSYEDTFGVVLTATNPPATNTSFAEPDDADACSVVYDYLDVITNTPTEYYSWQAVESAHGVGSELANVARLYMGAEFNGLDSIITVVPDGDSEGDYISALTSLETENVNFILMLYLGSETVSSIVTVLGKLYNHCQTLSDPVTGQMERKALMALPNDKNVSDYNTLIAAMQAKDDHGKSCYVILPDGLAVAIDSWKDENGEYQTDYTHDDSAGVDITPLILAGGLVAKYLSLNDLAMPMTEKSVAGFSFSNTRMSFSQVKDLSDDGFCVVKNDSLVPVCYRSINASFPSLTVEDAEMNINTTEMYIKQDMRRRLTALRGQKMTTAILMKAEDIIKSALDYYVLKNLIAIYDPSSVVASQNETTTTRLDAYFEYKPMYPVNQIWVEFGYTFDVE